MAKMFYLKLAWSNVKRNRLTYVPYLLAIALMSGMYQLIVGMIKSETLGSVPSGDSAKQMFQAGIIIFSFFAVFFMFYINNFLVNRRKREFGLYGVLGLDKGHISRVLLWENAIVMAGGLLLGTIIAWVFGYLLFLLLLNMLNFVGDSSFSIGIDAYIVSYGLFAIIFVVTSIWNSVRVHALNPMSLLQSEKKGDKPSKLMIPAAILGVVLLLGAYYHAWTTAKAGTAIAIFLALVVLVIVATFLVFSSGSTLLLTLLRKNKRYYYKPKNFVTVSGMFHRMRQNARGLSFICILSTMLIVTVAGTLALYLGRENIYRENHPYDVFTYVFSSNETDEQGLNQAYADAICELAEKSGVTLVADVSKFSTDTALEGSDIFVNDLSEVMVVNGRIIYAHNEFMFDVIGSQEDCLAFVDKLYEIDKSQIGADWGMFVSDIFNEREMGLGAYGGLLFLGVFFGVLFLAMTVLIIYFKQVTEGYEDKQRFIILQQVGMDKKMVKGTINRQVQWMFFLPLFATLLHMVFASKIMSTMLVLFQISDWLMVLACIGGVCVVFILLYLLVFRLTAKAYYKIVALK